MDFESYIREHTGKTAAGATAKRSQPLSLDEVGSDEPTHIGAILLGFGLTLLGIFAWFSMTANASSPILDCGAAPWCELATETTVGPLLMYQDTNFREALPPETAKALHDVHGRLVASGDIVTVNSGTPVEVIARGAHLALVRVKGGNAKGRELLAPAEHVVEDSRNAREGK